MIDPAEYRRLAELCFDDDVNIPATSAVTRIVDHLPQVASALTDAAELAEKHAAVLKLLAETHAEYSVIIGDRIAERDAARAEVERLRAGIRGALDVERPCLIDELQAVKDALRALLGGDK